MHIIRGWGVGGGSMSVQMAFTNNSAEVFLYNGNNGYKEEKEKTELIIAIVYSDTNIFH